MTRDRIFKLTPDGRTTWVGEAGDSYLLTGVDMHGKRFTRRGTYAYLRGFHPMRGSRWLIRGGKRFLIERIYN